MIMGIERVLAKIVGMVFKHNEQIGIVLLSRVIVNKEVFQILRNHDNMTHNTDYIWKYHEISIIYTTSKSVDFRKFTGKKKKQSHHAVSKKEESISVSWPSEHAYRRNKFMWWSADYGPAILKKCVSGGGTMSENKRYLSFIESKFLMSLMRLCRKEVNKPCLKRK